MAKKDKNTGLKFVLGFCVYSLTTAVVMALIAFSWAAHEFGKPGPLEETLLIEIPRGTSSAGIARSLANKRAISDENIFRFGTLILGAHDELKAGEYELRPGMSTKDIVHLIRSGKTVGRRFTIREGLTSYEIVRLLKDIENLSGDVDTIPPEGTLLPNTYDYRKNEDRTAILKRLESGMEKIVLPACLILLEREAGVRFYDMLDMECSSAPKPLKTVHDVLVLASIVEKETGVAEERERVAGVFINRLRKNIALQTDPTVIYAITKGKHKNDGKGPLGRRLLKKDLELDSPYNTYKYPGLPPGPIANPGRASIEAVLNPEEHDYIYFVADGTGGHVFAKTLEEHNRNVSEWRKIRRNKN